MSWSSSCPAGGSNPAKRLSSGCRRRKSSLFKTILEVPPVYRLVLMKMSQNNPDKDDQTSSSKKSISLPISRVRLIMKSSPDVSSINQDALFLTTKATVRRRISLIYHRLVNQLQLAGISSVSFGDHCSCSCSSVCSSFSFAFAFALVLLLKELFVQHLAVSSFNNGSGKETNTLSYSDLANTAEETETFHFLTGGTQLQSQTCRDFMLATLALYHWNTTVTRNPAN